MSRFALFVALAICVTEVTAQAVPLTTNRPVRRTLAAGDTARFEIALDSNWLARLTVEQTSVNVRLRALSPRNAPISGTDASPRGTEFLQFEATQKGTHHVQVFAGGNEPGEFVITLVAREVLSTDPRRLTDQLLAPRDRRDAPGAAVAVWRGGRMLYAKAYGMANLAYDIPFTVTTPTNIGSTTKQFTAMSVMLLVEDGKLTLDDDIRKHVPELPDLGQTVKVRHLLNHTSGYRELFNLLILEGRRLDIGDGVENREVITAVQRQPALQNTPGTEFNYNNTGYALLALTVERVSGKPLDVFMAERIFKPLGMTNSYLRMNRHHVIPGQSVGYIPGPDGRWLAIPDLGGSKGAGGIFTSVTDLMKWADNYTRPRVGTAASHAQMMTPPTLSGNNSTTYGFGLTIGKLGALKLVQHGGADLSHRSQFFYFPEIDAGLTVQSNFSGFDGSVVNRIARAFFASEIGTPPRPVAGAFDPASFKPESFDVFAGRYTLDPNPNLVLTFSRSGDTLFTQLTGQGRNRIYPTSDSTFELRTVAASVSFHRDATGKVSHAMLHQGGDVRASRVAGDAEPPWKPTSVELGTYTGRYVSEEVEAFYTVRVVDSTLVLDHRRLPTVRLATRQIDTFVGSGPLDGVTLVFERDRNRKVIGFYLSNGRTRNVRFERQ